MNNQQLDVLSRFEKMQKQLKQNGRLWDSWPCDELYNSGNTLKGIYNMSL